MRLQESDDWKAALAQSKATQRLPFEERILQSIRDSGIDELIEICGTGTVDEQTEAMRLLASLSRRAVDRLRTNDRWSRWMQIVKVAAEQQYPRTAQGTIAFGVLRDQVPDDARALLTSLPSSGWTPSEAQILIRDLRIDASAVAMACLQRIEESGGDVGHAAKDALAEMGLANPTELDVIGKQWQQTKMSAPLNKLWDLHLSRIPYGAPATDVFRLLGQPTSRDGRVSYFQAVDSDACLVLGEDEHGGVVTLRMGG